ncbi:MAG TPA: GldG family protein [Opitutaceae bacterium]
MKTFESFESNRWVWRINNTLQTILVVALVVLVNYIGMHAYMRFDLTRNRAFSLSPETLSYVSELREPVTVVVTIASDSEDHALAQAYRDVRGILREFEYATRANRGGRIDVEFLNIFEQVQRAETLGVTQANVVAFKSGARSRTVFLDELYATRNRTRSQFQGEKVFTSALLDVSTRERPVLYFLSGHGEMRLDDVDPRRGASQIKAQLAGRNYETRILDLSASRRLPDDAAMVVILSPKTPILGAEQEILREYLRAGNGRLLVTLDPGRKHGLDDLFFEWGILADDVVAIEANPAYQDPGGDLRVGRMAAHPITQVLIDNQIPVIMGYTRSVRPDPGRPIDDSLQVAELLATSSTPSSAPTSWGEANYATPGRPSFDPDRDLRGPIMLATVAERKIDASLGISLQRGRLIVFGNSDFLANHRVEVAGNLTLFLNSISWALGRDSRLKIPARTVDHLKLTLSQEQLAITRVSILFGPGLAVALFGGIVYLARRR